MMKVDVSGLKKKRDRYKDAKKYVEGMILGYAHLDAYSTIKAFQKNLLVNGYNLKPLKQITIDRKVKKKYKYPDIPLTGKAKTDKRSIYNSLRLHKIKNGTRVFVSKEKHHEANIPIDRLVAYHEAGFTFKAGDTMVKVPSRPVFTRAVKKQMKEASGLKKTRLKEMRKAIDIFANTGGKHLIDVIAKFRELGSQYQEK